ncbi:helix-turn-helix transcriptional regulator [Oscillospiraceae bacterium 44-34]|jgi:putative transcriptional regulator|uniref:helix-turn-helix domain-containing protein n=1 Tax=uncultured Oscillibacter sp. TaxID=876091 RepID=UPI00260ACDEA|nr:helix-turn-helix transcriptional regulator [uncultured Oscillibacter sp.]
MAITYRIDIIPALKAAGYNTSRIRKEHLLGEATLQKFRQKELVSWQNIDTLCRLLQCQPGDLLMYQPNSK